MWAWAKDATVFIFVTPSPVEMVTLATVGFLTLIHALRNFALGHGDALDFLAWNGCWAFISLNSWWNTTVGRTAGSWMKVPAVIFPTNQVSSTVGITITVTSSHLTWGWRGTTIPCSSLSSTWRTSIRSWCHTTVGCSAGPFIKVPAVIFPTNQITSTVGITITVTSSQLTSGWGGTTIPLSSTWRTLRERKMS